MADHFSTRQQELALKVEATPGSVESLTGADVVLEPYTDLNFTPDFQRVENETVSADLSKSPDIVAGERATIAGGITLQGSGSRTTAPAAGRFLRVLGLLEEVVKLATLSAAPAGGDTIFAAGEILTSGAKQVKVDQDASGTSLRFIQIAGAALADTDVLTAPDGDSATVSGAPADYGFRYTPRSTSHETFTVQSAEKNINGTSSQDFMQRIRGALGTGRIEATALQQLKLFFEITGVVDYMGPGSFAANPSLEVVAPENLPLFRNATIQIDGQTLHIGQFTLDLQNTVELDPDGSTVGGTAGYDRSRINDRDPSVGLDPARTPPSVFDDLGKLKSGAFVGFRFESTDVVGQTIEILAPRCQVTAWSPGERQNKRVADMTLSVRRSTEVDGDYKIYFR